MKMLLSICIPTYNRKRYLQELLEGLLPQVVNCLDAEICISDNKSSDGTDAYVRSLPTSVVRAWTNEKNIGGDRNFLKCICEAKGEYVWLVGDDDLVPKGAVDKVLEILHREHPDLLISTDLRGHSDPVVYDGYGDYLKEACRRSAFAAMAHTLISANVFRRSTFDMDFAMRTLPTQYSHMFGLVKNLKGRIILTESFVATRPVRAAFAKYPDFLCVKQAVYLAYLAKRFGLPRFVWFAFVNACNLPLEFASRIKNWVVQEVRGV